MKGKINVPANATAHAASQHGSMRCEPIQAEKTVTEQGRPAPLRRLCQRLCQHSRLGLLGLALLVAGATGVAALSLHSLEPAHSGPPSAARLVWYIQQGQLKADLRTLGCAVEYVLRSEAESEIEATAGSPALAGSVPLSSPKS